MKYVLLKKRVFRMAEIPFQFELWRMLLAVSSLRQVSQILLSRMIPKANFKLLNYGDAEDYSQERLEGV